MKLFAAKTYPMKVDIYTSVSYQDPVTGQITFNWNYKDPETVECMMVAIRPTDSLESFGVTYVDKEYVMLNMKYAPLLAQKCGNLRSKDGEKMYERSLNNPYVFNIDGVTPQVDPTGSRVDNQVFLSLSTDNPGAGNIASGD